MLVKFKLEENRLINWAKLVKLDYKDESLTFNHMSRMLVLDVMTQQRDLLTKFRELRDKKGYQKFALTHRTKTTIQVEEAPDVASDNGDSTRNGHGTLLIESKAVQFPSNDDEQIVQKALAFVKRFQDGMANVPRRLQWATIHKERMGELIEKLADLNTKMHEALGQGQMEMLLSMQKRQNYEILSMNQKFDQFMEIIQSQRLSSSRQRARIVDWDDEAEYDDLEDRIVPRRRMIEPLGELAQTKALGRAIEDSKVLEPEDAERLGLPKTEGPSKVRHTQIPFTDMYTRDGQPLSTLDDDDDSVRTEAYYKDFSVWVEWKTIEHTNPGEGDSLVEECVKKLSALLETNNSLDDDIDTLQFRAPHCFGYFKDDEMGRFGLVFKKPGRAKSFQAPVSLHSLLTKKDAQGQPIIPSLTQRVTLMRLICETIERLHAVDWLHKGLRSANILLFKALDSEEINFSDPYISGFEYSRPAGRDDMTERPSDDLASDIYRHPSVQQASKRSNSRKSHDIYSLGILLLEIAYWMPLDQILGFDLETVKPKAVHLVRQQLLSVPQYLRSVKSYQGDTVEDIIRTCLEGPEAFGLGVGFDERSDDAGPKLQKAFGEKVVARLEHMRGL